MTERARAEQSLRDSEARFRRMAEHLPFPIILSRIRDRKLLYGNPRAVALFNGGSETPIRDGAAYFDDPSDREAIWGEIARAGKVSERELRLHRPDGTPIWALFSAVVTEMEGEPVALAVLADITMRKQAEVEREALAAQLQEALANVKTLSGLVPICANCKKIRDDAGYWRAVEQYIGEHSRAEFTQSICPDCMKKLHGDFMEEEELSAASQAASG